MTKMIKFSLVFLIVVLLCTMTGCDWFKNEQENAVVPVDSVSRNVNEAGVFSYASHTKKHYAYALREGDIGTVSVTLDSKDGNYFFSGPWWVDGYKQHITADVLMIAGKVGDVYQGVAVCHKCDVSVPIEGVIEPDGDTITTIECDCCYNNCHFGKKKILTVIIIALEE